MEKSFSEIFLIEVGSFTTLTLFLIESRIEFEFSGQFNIPHVITKINMQYARNVNSSIDGIGASEINKTHVVSSVPSTTAFRITVLSNATNGSIAGGGSDVVVTFQN